MNIPSTESVLALDGRDCSTLTGDERQILAFYLVYGLHHSIGVGVVSTIDVLETGLRGLEMADEVIRQSSGTVKVGKLSSMETPEQSARRHASIREYFEAGCLCILTGEIQKKPETVSDFEASVYYENSCKCSRNYPPFGG